MPLIPINDIQIKPDRQRQFFDPKRLEELSESIRTVGQLQPIILDRENFLVAGERRIKACQLLGWTEIRFEYLDTLDPWEQEVAQLDENLHREALSVTEELAAKKKLHEVFVAKYGEPTPGRGSTGLGWKVKDTAERLGISVGKVSEDLQLAQAVEKNPEWGQLKTKAAIRGAYKRDQEIKGRTLLAALTKKKKQDSVKTTSSGEGVLPLESSNITLIHDDCLAYIPTMVDASISALITDPPWQVEFDSQFGSDPKTGLEITKKMLKAVYPKLQEGALCLMFCATKHLIWGTTAKLILDCGYRVFDSIFEWYKPNVAHNSHPYSQPSSDYEPIMFFSKGSPRDMTHPSNAVLEHQNHGRKLHPAQKPVELLQYLIELVSVEGELVFDPFVGSGNLLLAAHKSKRAAVGVEMDDKNFTIADSNITIEMED